MRHLLFKLLILMVFSGYGAIASAATFTVTSDDGGNVTNSLHAAIILANASASDDTIEFSGSISSIVLTADLPAVTRNLTITGTGQASLTISGGGLFTIFRNVTSGVTLTISNLTLTNNKSGEGSILYNKYADFVASYITVSGVTKTSAFYGVEANTITISNSIFENNSAKLFGSDYGDTPSTTEGTYTNKITVTGSSFTSNTATIFQTERYVKIDNCTFAGNNSIGNFNGLNRYQVLNSNFTNNSGTLFSFFNSHLGTGWGSDSLSNYHHLFDNNTFTNNSGTVINPGSNLYYDAVTTISNNTFSGNGTNWSGSPAVVSGNTIVDTTAPIITSNSGGSTAAISLAENITEVTTVVATDANTLTYSITGGADQAKFSILSGVLSFSSAPNFESPTDTGSNNTYVVEVTATDTAGNTDVQTITVTITDATESASFTINTISNASIAESAAYTSVVPATSGATPIGSLTYTLGGTDAGDFTINSTTGVVSMVARDYETPVDDNTNNTYIVEVTATDSDGNNDREAWVVSVTDVDENKPTITFSPANSATGIAANSNITLTFNEALRLLDNTALSNDNVDALITLKANNSSGTDIAFDATIDTDKKVITINPTSDFSSEQVIYVAIGTTVEDSANNAISAASATFTSIDTVAPTVTFSPANSATSIAVDANITITFNEAIRKASDDSEITNSTADDLITLKLTNSSGADIDFDATIDSDKKVITINPSSDFTGLQTVYVAIGTTVEDSADNAISASNATFTVVVTALPTPLNKKDVVASVETWSNITSKWAGNVMDSITDRLNWLSRHTDATQTSYQGIKIHFENEIIEAVMSATPRSKSAIVADAKDSLSTSKAIALLQNTQGALVATGDNITSDAQSIALNEAARFRNDIIGSLNPSFGTVVDDWSVWTSGQITIGETKASTTSSKQDGTAHSISLGFDKPLGDDKQDLVGVVLSIGQNDVDIGTSTSNTKSDNYSLSTYAIFKQDNDTSVEAIFGLSHIKLDSTRIDGNDTLTGKRNAEQVFASATLRDKTIEHNNWSISPYGKLTLAHTKLKKFSEVGSTTALTFNDQSINDAKVYIGADANYLITINNGTIKPFAKLEYGHDVSRSSDATMYYNSETTLYTLSVDKKAKSNWKMDIGADLFTEDGWNSSISYRREQAIDSGHSDSLSFDVGLKF